MISNKLIGEALLRNDNVVSCQFLGKGIFLLRMIGDEFAQKMNSYAVMNVLEPELDEVDMQCALAAAEFYEANWEELESDDGHRELYQNN
jgi:hypothetical protein